MDKKFYKFRESSEHQRDVPFAENDWDKMEKRLDAAEKGSRKPIPMWWWMAAAAAFLVVIGFGALMSSLQKSQQMNEQLLGQLEKLSTTNTTTTTTTDTIFQKEIVVMRDTIQIIKTIRESKAKNDNATIFAFQPESKFTQQSLFAKEDVGTLARLLEAKKDNSLGGLLTEARINRINEENEEYLELLNQSLAELAIPKIEEFDLNYQLSDDYLTESEPILKSKKKHLMKALLMPVGFMGGISGGFNTIANKLDRNGTGHSFGLQAELLFRGNLSLWGEVSYAKLRYITDENDPKSGLPFIEAPGDDYVFEEAEINLNTLTFMLGMKKRWNANGKIQPFVSVGLGALQLLPYSAIYEFENDVLDTEIKTEVEVEEYAFQGSIGQVGLGAEFKLSKNWRMGLEGYFRTQLDKDNFNSPDYLGLKTALIYQF